MSYEKEESIGDYIIFVLIVLGFISLIAIIIAIIDPTITLLHQEPIGTTGETKITEQIYLNETRRISCYPRDENEFECYTEQNKRYIFGNYEGWDIESIKQNYKMEYNEKSNTNTYYNNIQIDNLPCRWIAIHDFNLTPTDCNDEHYFIKEFQEEPFCRCETNAETKCTNWNETRYTKQCMNWETINEKQILTFYKKSDEVKS